MVDDASSDGQLIDGGATLIGPGRVVLVVGPSGAGKDALLAGARQTLEACPDIVFPERIISRPSHAAEVHASITEGAFAAALSRGAYALTWQAHGLHYGISSTVDGEVQSGKTVVFNTSRGIIEGARRRYAHVSVVLIETPIEIRAERLSLRGRESVAEIRARLDRTVASFDPASADAVIRNAGNLAEGVLKLVRAIRGLSGMGNAREL